MGEERSGEVKQLTARELRQKKGKRLDRKYARKAINRALLNNKSGKRKSSVAQGGSKPR